MICAKWSCRNFRDQDSHLQDISLFPFGFGQRPEKIAHIRLVSRMAASLALDAAAVYEMYYIR